MALQRTNETLSSSSTRGSSSGRVQLKRKRGRPRNPAIDPSDELGKIEQAVRQTAAGGRAVAATSVTLRPKSKSGHHRHVEPVDGIDRYLDADYLADERRRRYLPQDFHIAIKNEHDHEGTPIKIRRHPLMEAAMNEMVNCDEFPIGSAQDIYNVGAYQLMRKLYYLRQSGGKITNWMSQLKAQSDMVYMSEQSRTFQKTVERLKVEVGELSKLGAFGKRQAAVLVVQVRNEAKAMRDTAWGKWYLDQIDEEFGELVRSQEQRVRIRRGER